MHPGSPPRTRRGAGRSSLRASPRGITGMDFSVSNTAEYGGLTRGARVISEPARQAMKDILAEIQSGDFAREWIAENRAGQERLLRLREEMESSQIEREGKDIRAKMPWIDQGEL